MNSLSKAVVVVLLHIAIVLSLGGKLLYDRAHRPRIWVRTGSVDPDLPIRGRYMTLNVRVHAPEFRPSVSKDGSQYGWESVYLAVENGELVAHRTEKQTHLSVSTWGRRPAPGDDVYLLSPSLAFFLPEHAIVPDVKRGEELWAEVTVPRKGPPRPIQLALKRGSEWRPLTYR